MQELILTIFSYVLDITVEPRYNKGFGTMKITSVYQVYCYIRVEKKPKEI